MPTGKMYQPEQAYSVKSELEKITPISEAHEWVQKRNPDCDSAEHWYHEQMAAFKAGAHYGIGAVIDWLESDESRSFEHRFMVWRREPIVPGPKDWAAELRKRFQSGQASDGGKENG